MYVVYNVATGRDIETHDSYESAARVVVNANMAAGERLYGLLYCD